MLKVLSLFSGIGSFEKSLNRLGIEFDVVNYCEIDKYASKSYSLIHDIPENKNLWDIKNVDEIKLPDFDLMTWGFPCTDISSAGKMSGFFDETGKQTRSGLYYDGIRILTEKKPKYSIIENVKNLISKKFKNEFQIILNDLNDLGYNNYWKVLNSKDYGIPQNRQRVFIISIRKDIDDETFEFPEPFDNGLRLKNFLEDEKDVDPKMYRIVKSMIRAVEKGKVQIKNCNSIDNTITTKQERWNNAGLVEVLKREIKPDGFPREGYDVYGINGLCPTLKASSSQTHSNFSIDGKFRYLTPLECFRLMGFDDCDYNKVKNYISKTQLYKQAGNSIVVNVLDEIFKNLLLNRKNLNKTNINYFFN